MVRGFEQEGQSKTRLQSPGQTPTCFNSLPPAVQTNRAARGARFYHRGPRKEEATCRHLSKAKGPVAGASKEHPSGQVQTQVSLWIVIAKPFNQGM